MYHYKSFNERGGYDKQYASTEMFINGDSLSSLIDGYRHLTVSGRGIIPIKHDIEDIPFRPGAWVNESHEEVRVLTIKYQMQSFDSQHARDQFELLNYHLEGLLEVKFYDEMEYTYYGYLSSADDIEDNALAVVSTFSIIVPDVYKFKDAQTSGGEVRLRNNRSVTPSKIVVKPTDTVNELSVHNGDLRIEFKGAYEPSYNLTIEWSPEEVTAFYQGRNVLNEMQRFSDLENFILNDGDVITGTNCTIESVEWRDMRK